MTEAQVDDAILEASAAAADDDWEHSRRQDILDAAFSLLMEQGYPQTSTLAIATRAHVSKRDVYRLFDSKQAILIACIERRAEQMRLPLALPEPHDRLTLVATLTSFGAGVLRELSSPSVIALYRLAASEAGRLPDAVAGAIDTAGRQAIVTALSDFLARAQSSGLLDASAPSLMASHFLGLLLGDLQLRLVLGVLDPPTSDEVARRTREATDALLRLHPATSPDSSTPVGRHR